MIVLVGNAGKTMVSVTGFARRIVNANHSIMRATAKLCVVNCVAGSVWFTVPQPTEWERIGNQIDAASILGSDFRNIALVANPASRIAAVQP